MCVALCRNEAWPVKKDDMVSSEKIDVTWVDGHAILNLETD